RRAGRRSRRLNRFTAQGRAPVPTTEPTHCAGPGTGPDDWSRPGRSARPGRALRSAQRRIASAGVPAPPHSSYPALARR
ncbi:MAG: hypothetical protein AAGC55_28190, partial [Myxococcota bacterium]